MITRATWSNYWLGLILASSKAAGTLGDSYLLDFTTPIDHYKSYRVVRKERRGGKREECLTYVQAMFFLPWYIPTCIARRYVVRYDSLLIQDVKVWNVKKVSQ